MGSFSSPSYPPTPAVHDVTSYAELRALTENDLVRLIDQTLASGLQVHLDFYRDEIARRDAERTSREMIELTKQIRALTIAVAAVAIIALAISVVALIKP